MRTATIFADRVSVRAAEEVFAGYLDGTDWTKGENRRLSRAHRQPNRIYGTGGVHPAISSSETQGRYWIVYEDG